MNKVCCYCCVYFALLPGNRACTNRLNGCWANDIQPNVCLILLTRKDTVCGNIAVKDWMVAKRMIFSPVYTGILLRFVVTRPAPRGWVVAE